MQTLRHVGLLRQLDRPHEALTALHKSVRLDPTWPDQVVALPSLLAELGAFEEVLDLLQEA